MSTCEKHKRHKISRIFITECQKSFQSYVEPTSTWTHGKTHIGLLLDLSAKDTAVELKRACVGNSHAFGTDRGHTKSRATIGRPRGNGRPHSPHSQRCHRSVRSMFMWGALYVRCSSWRLIGAVFTVFL